MLWESASLLKAACSQAGNYSTAGSLVQMRVPRRLEEKDSPSAVDNSVLGSVQLGPLSRTHWGSQGGCGVGDWPGGELREQIGERRCWR